MKTKIALLSLFAVVMSAGVFAQGTEETDDMYFTSKDRAVLNAAHQSIASVDVRKITESETSAVINPTDNYSGRSVNPEYVSGAKVGSNPTNSVSFFNPNYQPTAVNQALTNYNGFNNNCNTCGGYNNNYYNSYGRMSNPYGYNGFNNFGSPYGMGMSPYGYNSFGGYGMGNSFNSPYSGFSMGFGSSYGNGWSTMLGYGMNSYFGGGYGSPYSSFGGYGYNSYGYGNSYYGSSAVVVADRPRPQSTRNQEIDRYYGTDATRTGGTANSGGRVAAENQQYYNRTWRNDAQVTTNNNANSSWSNSNNTHTYQRSYDNSWNNNNNNNNSWNNSNSNWGNNSSGGRSFSTGGGSSGGGGSSSGGGGARRGRD